MQSTLDPELLPLQLCYPIPSKGPPWPGPCHQEVSAGFCRGTEQWLSWHSHTQLTVVPGSGCARLLPLVSQCCMGSVGTNQHLHHRH